MKFFDKLKKNYELKKDKKQKNKEREKYHKEVLLDEKKNKSNKKIAPNDAYISLLHINKIYDNHVQAVFDFNLDIQKHEFIVFVGPSGCGKSTTLRMIAGLEDITSGDLYIDGTYSNDLTPKERDISMVFQSYALFPNMTVYQNMAFGLKINHVNKEELDRRVRNAAEILQLTDYLDRKPANLSGGQMQRVALGRAIVKDSKLFLMDEPLSNLDAKLRVQMRTEIAKLHERLGATMIYVTHDQTEAMTLGTKIVVMKDGIVQQVDTPQNLYNYPKNKFVAGFIGSPQMNFIDTTVCKKGDKVTLKVGNYELELPEAKGKVLVDSGYVGKEVSMGIRPEDVYDLSESDKASSGLEIESTINVYELLGSEVYLYFNIDKFSLTARVNPNTPSRVGDNVKFKFDMNKVHIFDNKTGLVITN